MVDRPCRRRSIPAWLVAALAAQLSRYTPDPAQALLMAQGELARVIGRNALTSAFNEAFQLMSWMFLAAVLLAPFCRPAPQGQAAARPVDAH